MDNQAVSAATRSQSNSTLIYRTAMRAEVNGCAAGTYEWHNSLSGAESVALPGTSIHQTSPGLWRARVQEAA